MLFFRKNIIIVTFFFVTIASVQAQSFIPKAPYRSIISDIAIVRQNESHHTIMPFVCYDNFLFANTGGFGCDFKYSRPSGFALYGNVGLLFGGNSLIVCSLEGLLGYSKTFAKKHQIAFGIGLQGAYGVGMMEFIALAFRLEYSYLITHKYGIHFSFTDGLGFGIGRDRHGASFINRASLRAGPIIYF